MPYLKHSPNTSKTRILISGFPNTGKTTSLLTFMYGQHDPHSEDSDEAAAAQQVAGDKQMAILTCPGEFGHKSLPANDNHITSYFYETQEGEDTNSVEWSKHALNEFDTINKQIIASKPDIYVLDGIHALWSHIMNRTSDGDYLTGRDLNISAQTGKFDPYRGAKFYSQAHNAFGQYIASMYLCPIPLIIATTWEEWKSGRAEGDKPGDIGATRYLWPAIGGGMAQEIVGKYDARLSARIERRCFHKDCVDSQQSVEHYVWQVLSKGEVQGVGIKGMKRIPPLLKERPYIHQDASVLWKLIAACS